MSLDTTIARVSELQTQLGIGAAVAGTTGSATLPAPGVFAAQLGQAIGGAPASDAATGDASGASAYDTEIAAAAGRYGVDPALVRAVVKNESGFDPNATSAAGAQGLMQLMPGTAAGLGVTDPYDPAQSIDAGTRYLRAQLDRFGGDASLAVAAYNAGPNAVARAGGIPPYAETQAYVRSVLADAGASPLASSALTTAGRTAW